jgi:hypothetical protein
VQAQIPECGAIVAVDACGAESEVTARLLACLAAANVCPSALAR